MREEQIEEVVKRKLKGMESLKKGTIEDAKVDRWTRAQVV